MCVDFLCALQVNHQLLLHACTPYILLYGEQSRVHFNFTNHKSLKWTERALTLYLQNHPDGVL